MLDMLQACVVGIPIDGTASLPAALIVPKSNSKITQSHVYNTIAGKKLSNLIFEYNEILDQNHYKFVKIR